MRDLPPPPARTATPASAKQETPTTAAAPTPSETPPRDTATGSQAAGGAKTRTTPKKRPARGHTAVATTVLLPVDLVEHVRTTARREDTTITALVLRILTNELDHLADLVAAETPAQTATGPFPDTAERPPSELKGQLFLRLTPANAQALDELVTTSGAFSRSRLNTAALRSVGRS